MSETNNSGDKTLSANPPPKPTLHLKRPVEQGTVRQSFSHGRSKAVVVEKVKRRVVGPGEVAAARGRAGGRQACGCDRRARGSRPRRRLSRHADRPPPTPVAPPKTGVSSCAPSPRSRSRRAPGRCSTRGRAKRKTAAVRRARRRRGRLNHNLPDILRSFSTTLAAFAH